MQAVHDAERTVLSVQPLPYGLFFQNEKHPRKIVLTGQRYYSTVSADALRVCLPYTTSLCYLPEAVSSLDGLRLSEAGVRRYSPYDARDC